MLQQSKENSKWRLKVLQQSKQDFDWRIRILQQFEEDCNWRFKMSQQSKEDSKWRLKVLQGVQGRAWSWPADAADQIQMQPAQRLSPLCQRCLPKWPTAQCSRASAKSKPEQTANKSNHQFWSTAAKLEADLAFMPTAGLVDVTHDVRRLCTHRLKLKRLDWGGEGYRGRLTSNGCDMQLRLFWTLMQAANK